ncbi:MAG: tetratricopeptide repeat protein [Clostridia bacterium]|nr:tetratricopeptide repeat protein [Clostridia bacterium]
MGEKLKVNLKALVFIAGLIIVLIIPDIFRVVIIPRRKYDEAVILMNNGQYDEAELAFNELENRCFYRVEDCRYNRAVMLMERGNYTDAMQIFRFMDGYRESYKMMHDIYFKYGYISCLDVGEDFLFGHADNGKSYKWKILDVSGDRALIIATEAVEKCAYSWVDCSTENEETWENCHLRSWLNSDFIENTFVTEERDRILLTCVEADANPDWRCSTDQGGNTADRAFLLSINEVNKYLTEESDRKCWNEGGIYYYDSWWLRNTGVYQDYAAVVRASDGEILCCGANRYTECLVRPAMWIKIR